MAPEEAESLGTMSLSMTWVKMGNPNRELQEYSRNRTGIYLARSLYSYDIPTIFLEFPI